MGGESSCSASASWPEIVKESSNVDQSLRPRPFEKSFQIEAVQLAAPLIGTPHFWNCKLREVGEGTPLNYSHLELYRTDLPTPQK